MTALLLIVFSAVSGIGQTLAPWVALSKKATGFQEADQFAAAEVLHRQALRVGEQELGPSDPLLAPLLSNLALSLHAEARDAEAEPFARRAYTIAEKNGEPRLTGLVLNALGVVLAGEGEVARAEPVLRRSVAILAQAEGEQALDVAKAANNLSTLYADTHQFAKAEKELKLVLSIYEKELGPDHPLYAMASANMFNALHEQHRIQEGEPYLRRALAIGEVKFPQSLNMVFLQHCLAALEVAHENYKEAARILEQVITREERLLGPDHPLVARALVNYSSVLKRLHQKTEAKQAMNRANLILKTLH